MTTVQLDQQGLVPAIAQNADTGEVIMLGYTNAGALKRTLEGGEVWFYSRSRADLWHKGEVSGNYMHVKSVSVDCDADTLLLQVDPDGPICHTGNETCFFTPIDKLPSFESPEKGPRILDELYGVIQGRKRDKPEGSSTSSLLDAGIDRISQKVVEEAGETAIAGVKGDVDNLSEEIADLLFHTLVLMAALDVNPETVWAKLRERRR